MAYASTTPENVITPMTVVIYRMKLDPHVLTISAATLTQTGAFGHRLVATLSFHRIVNLNSLASVERCLDVFLCDYDLKMCMLIFSFH